MAAIQGAIKLVNQWRLRSASIGCLGKQLAHGFMIFTKRNPKSSAAITTFTIGFAGDAVCQKAIESSNDYDHDRSVRIAGFSAFYCSLFYSPLLKWYAATFNPTVCGGSMTIANTAKVCCDNFLTSPLLYFPMFYAWIGLSERRTLQQTADLARESYWRHNVAHTLVWVPALALCFARVPAHLQVLFVNFVSVGWTCSMSYITHSSHPDNKMLQEAAASICAQTAAQTATPTLLVQNSADEGSTVDKGCDMATEEGLDSQTVRMDSQTVRMDSETVRMDSQTVRMDSETVFDAWITKTFNASERESMHQYRTQYQQFRRGEAHGCKGETFTSPVPNDRKTWERVFREQYGNFRKGSAHGAKGNMCGA